MTACPLCQAQDHNEFARVDSFGYPVTYQQCNTCGFVFQDPGETQAADPGFYAETYRKIYQASPEPSAKDLRQQELRAADQAAFLREQGLTPRRILDIGASSGLLLDKLRGEFGAEVAGVEPGDAYRALAAARLIPMSPSIEALIEAQPAAFDLVTLMHVLEHLPEPQASLRQIRERLLKKDGYLLVEVPNFYAHDSYELAHLACYTPASLRQMLEQAGYRIIAERKHGWPRSKTLPLYIGALAQALEDPHPAAVVPEKNVARKRGLAMLQRKIISKLQPKTSWLPLEGPQ